MPSDGEAITTLPTQAQFPHTLQTLRLARRWKQKELAQRLHVNPRTYISWETGERLPPLASVLLLGWLLEEPSRSHLLAQSRLLSAFMLDELRRHAQKDTGGRELTEHVLTQLLETAPEEGDQQTESNESAMLLLNQFSTSLSQKQSGVPIEQPAQQASTSAATLQQLFALLEVLRQQPELIPVVQDFLHQVAAQ